jgi:hypothetical protein
MSEQEKPKNFVTEWSFSFENLGERLNNLVTSVTEEEELKADSFSEPKDGATSASINLHFSVGENTVKPLVDSDNLFEADVAYVGEIEFSSTEGPHKDIALRQQKAVNPVMKSIRQAIGSFGNRQDLRWDVRLSPDVPMDVNIHAGVGKSEMDLSQIQLTGLKFDAGVGEPHITLPESETGYAIKMNMGVGESHVTLPVNTNIDLDVNGGVGEVHFHIPLGASVHVKASSGLGDVKVPPHFERIEGKSGVGAHGVWETEDFANADDKITINYKGGVGSFEIVAV